MPKYTFKAPDGTIFITKLTFSEYEAVKSGEKKLVDDDGNTCELIFNPGTLGFVLKDGVSGGWVSKAMRENKYRAGRSQEMARRERDHVFKSRLVPNYQGQEAHSWADVKDHVRSKKGEVAASTYDHLVAQEKTGAST